MIGEGAGALGRGADDAVVVRAAHPARLEASAGQRRAQRAAQVIAPLGPVEAAQGEQAASRYRVILVDAERAALTAAAARYDAVACAFAPHEVDMSSRRLEVGAAIEKYDLATHSV